MDQKYLRAYVDEAKSGIRAMNRSLRGLAQSAAGPAGQAGTTGAADYGELFRFVHTVKASSLAMGFTRIAGLLHEMESEISAAMKGRADRDGAFADLFKRCLRNLDEIISDVSVYGHDKSAKYGGFPHEVTGAGVTFEVEGAGVSFEAAGKGISLETADAGVSSGNAPEATLGINGYDMASRAAEPVFGHAFADSVVRISLVPGCAMKGARALVILKAIARYGTVVGCAPNIEDIENGRFDRGFEVAVKSGTRPDALRSALSASADIERCEIIDKTTVGAVFSRMRTSLADMSAHFGKEAELTVYGGDIPCDFETAAYLTEMLTHVLRNSVDHGIEPADIRAAAGKKAKAAITLRASVDGGLLVVEASDDGMGLDFEGIRNKAAQIGILNGPDILNATDAEIAQLIFLPTLTTRENATVYSGRGIGLDAVKAKAESLGGDVSAESEKGRGVKTTIRIPYDAGGVQPSEPTAQTRQ